MMKFFFSNFVLCMFFLFFSLHNTALIHFLVHILRIFLSHHLYWMQTGTPSGQYIIDLCVTLISIIPQVCMLHGVRIY